MWKQFTKLVDGNVQLIKNHSRFLVRRQSDILAAALVIMVSYGLSFILGIARERLLYATFFSCCREELDAYRAAFRFPEMLFQISIAGTLSAAFIPLFKKRLEESVVKANQFAAAVLNLLLLTFSVGGILIWWFAPQLAHLLTGNFTEVQVQLMSTMMQLLLLSQVFFIASQLISGVLQSYHRFLAPALAPIVYNLGIVVGIYYLSEPLGIYGPVVGVIFGSLLHLLIQLPIAFKLGYRYEWPKEGVYACAKDIFALSLPRTLAMGVSQLEISAAVFFATSLSPGSLSLFDLAKLLRQVPVQLVGVAIGQAAFPSLSSYSSKDTYQYRKTLQDSILYILYLVLPISAILLILKIPIVRLAFGSSSFPWPATTETAMMLAMFTLSVPAYAVGQLVTRAFFAGKDTRTPLINNLFGLGLFLVLGYFATFVIDWSLFRNFPIRIDSPLIGLALASSIVGNIQTILLVRSLHIHINLVSHSLVKTMAKLGAATLVMLLCLWIPFQFLDTVVFDTTRVIPLIALTITVTSIGLAVYLIMCHILRTEPQLALWKVLIKFPGFSRLLHRTQTFWEPLPSPPSSNS